MLPLLCVMAHFLSPFLQWPGQNTQYSTPANTREHRDKRGSSVSLSAPLQLSNMCCLPSGSGHNTTALCWCLCICWVLRERGCRSCKLNIHAIACNAHNTQAHTPSFDHLRTALSAHHWVCAEYRSGRVGVGERKKKKKSNRGFTKDLEQASVSVLGCYELKTAKS